MKDARTTDTIKAVLAGIKLDKKLARGLARSILASADGDELAEAFSETHEKVATSGMADPETRLQAALWAKVERYLMSAEWTLGAIKSRLSERAGQATTKDEVITASRDASQSWQLALAQATALLEGATLALAPGYDLAPARAKFATLSALAEVELRLASAKEAATFEMRELRNRFTKSVAEAMTEEGATRVLDETKTALLGLETQS